MNAALVVAILLLAGALVAVAVLPGPRTVVIVEQVVERAVPVKPKPVKRIAPDPWRGLRSPGYALPRM